MPENIPEEKLTALSDMILGGNKIGAIKLYRKVTGVNAAEAKDAVEKMEADLRGGESARYAPKSRFERKGCLGSMLVIGLCGTVLVYKIVCG